MPVSNSTLMQIAAITGFATAAMGYAWRRKINDNICETVYYKEALETLQAHKGAVYLLGEPIRGGSIDVSNTKKNYTEPLNASYEVPVIGPKEKGILQFWAKRDSEYDDWNITRMELQLKSQPHKRLLVKTVKSEEEMS